MKNKIMDLDIDNISYDSSTFVQTVSDTEIAIIGMDAILPGNVTVAEFWDKLCSGFDFVHPIPETREKDIEDYFRLIGKQSVLIEDGAFLEDIDKFDYGFFNISPKEASLMDPNQRLFLETAWKAIEDAGYGGSKLTGSRTGVYVGFSNDTQYKSMITEVAPNDLPLAVTGNLAPIIASRISYLLNLRGPNMLVNTVCSSSLVALHLACQAIRNNECDMALAGGIQLHILPVREVKIGIESNDNRTRTFDAGSTGTGGGEGVIAMLLKPLQKAINDRDRIYAVIKGSAVNQDGATQGISAPNPAAQEDVIVRAWKDAGVNPESITYIEAHGTGTRLGDPIEIEGIQRAFKRYTTKKQFCAIGSVKSNIGHLDASAGMAGLLKVVLSLQAGKIPPLIHFMKPNAKIRFYKSPVYINDTLTDWVCNDKKRCGVSSFGFSGTNCHVVIEQAPSCTYKQNQNGNKANFLTVSAKSKESLKILLKQYENLLVQIDESIFENVCYTANTGRGQYSYRVGIIFSDKEDCRQKIAFLLSKDLSTESLKDVFYGKVINKAVGVVGRTDSAKFIAAQSSHSAGSFDTKDLAELLQKYISGTDFDWEIMYYDRRLYKVKVPTYPFERKRCWIDVPLIDSPSMHKNMIYETRWIQQELTGKPVSRQSGTALLILDKLGKGRLLAKKLIDSGRSVIEVDIGDTFKIINETHFQIGFSTSDQEKLIQHFQGTEISQVVDLHTIQSDKTDIISRNITIEMDKSLKWLFVFFKLLQVNIKYKVEVVLVAENANAVTGSESYIDPFSMSYFGLAKAASLENISIDVRCIDIDEQCQPENILKEITTRKQAFMVAYRQQKRYLDELCEVKNTDLTHNSMDIKNNGLYIITGGLGDIGLDFAEYFASKTKVKLALIGRSEFPPSSDWDGKFDHNSDPDICRKIRKLKEIIAAGSEVDYFQADVCELSSIRQVLDKIRNRFGKISGVIHSAGVGARSHGNLIKDENYSVFQTVLDAKIKGTVVLDMLTRRDNLDFLVLFSSAITIIGGVGSSHYTAANCFLDAFSFYRNTKGYKTLAIDWAPWNSDLLRHNSNINDNKHIFKPLEPANGRRAFETILASDKKRVIIGELNNTAEVFALNEYLPFRLSDELKAKLSDPVQSPYERKRKQYREIELTGKKNKTYSLFEKQVAQVWKDVLGYDEININDNFFELGGDSITITRAYSILNKIYPLKLNITDLFQFTTVASLAEYISSISGENTIIPQDCRHNGEKDLESLITDLFMNLDSGLVSTDDAVNQYCMYRRHNG